ncbi:hypothetical protein SDRG_05158 [Saprolegnia diclina VS20]|uniref:Myosin motor domain-containing protein n=1 Tax=Saprolegnia diclina (strain VS20) TaxID=1156394 RepID=T0QU87_SAPDV|nr:hypothetical protein SDRG_05158 [Saprolegnia diclina VS20]EQC37560.1 hypothetical protein SDRG_05158 [Saprolegnia diclina VS20]|eukprot:XP_008609080.1 hypothetical protein SDRG_05158 [Saprolegnia diclina VS20]
MEAGARVWVKDDDEIWVPGVVDECHDLHRVRVRRDGGRGDIDIDLRHGAEVEPSLHLRNDVDDFTNVPNLIQLQYLHEPELLFAVANRFEHDLIYTYIGDILLAFNPFRPINMYSMQHVRAYEAMDSDAPPHVFAIASMAYRCMRDEKKNQSILVSGESGAGKTENTKFLMQYLATVGAPTSSMTSSPAKTPAKRQSRLKTPVTTPVTTTTVIQTQILQTNPILEAFGNAKTVRNDNSSRFGKFIALQFGADHTIVGAKISVYLLEKIRLSHQSLGERNFHIFYELCAGADDDLADLLELSAMEDYAILSQSECYERRSVDDAAQFGLTTQAFRDMGVPDDETTSILSVVASLLHLGNVAFDAVNSSTSNLEMAAIAASSASHLATASRLLGVSSEALVTALVTRRIHTTREVVEVKLTAAQAEDAKQSLMQSIYGGLFLYIVERLSNIICHDRACVTTIGILDIFGFENLHTNGFEQLCINYANERLQAQFNDLVFAKEQRMYASEGIEWKYIEFPDNAPCLQLLEDRPTGMWCLLDEECILPKGSNEAWITKLYQTFLPLEEPSPILPSRRVSSADVSRRPPVVDRRMSYDGLTSHGVAGSRPFYASRTQQASFQFVIGHFAGRVMYELDAFLQKNQDALPAEAVALCQGSSAPMVQALLGAPKRGGKQSTANKGLSRAPSSLRTASVSAQFKSQLDDLISVIGSTQARYIRCVKSNDAGAPRCLHKPRVIQQLRSGGVLEAVRIARAGYAVREDHGHFVQAFGFLVPKPKKPKAGKTPPSVHRGDGTKQRTELVVAAVLLALDAPDAALAKTILSNGKYSRTELQDACGRAGFQLGYSKIFFRKEVYNQLRWLRRQTLTACTLQLQRLYRGHVAREEARARHKAVQVLQAWARAALTVRRQRKASATRIQAAFRRHAARTRYCCLRNGVDACQRFWRSRRIWRAAREARDARLRAEEATVAGQLRKQQEELARARDAIEAAAAAERAALAAERQRQKDEEAATRAAWAAERAAAEAAHREAFERELQAMRDELQRQTDEAEAARRRHDNLEHDRRVEAPGVRPHVSTSSPHARRLEEDEHERRATAREAIVVEAARVASSRHGHSSVTRALDAGDMAHVLGALGIQAPTNSNGENGDLVDNYAQCLQALSVVVEQPMVIKALTQILQAVSHPEATPPTPSAVVEADLVAPPPPVPEPEPHLPPALEPLHPVIDTVKEVYDYSMSYSVVRFLVTKIQDKATSRLSTILTNPTVQTALLTAHSLTATAWHAACEYYPLATQVSNDVERLRAAVLSRACVPLPATSMPLEEMLVNSAEVRQSLIELALEQEAKIKELEAAVAENASFFNQMASAMAHGPQVARPALGNGSTSPRSLPKVHPF